MRRSRMAVSIAAALLASAAAAQEWNYLAYNSEGKVSGTGSLKLAEGAPGQFKATLIAPAMNVCYRSELAAKVTAEGDQQVITVEPRMRDCPEIRFVVKADGSGGKREVKQADGTWKWDDLERGLKRK